MARCWLMKSEPYVYSIDDLQRDGSTHWEGVRNYQARNLMKEMAVGDRVLFYHSNAKPPGVVGVARVCRTAYPDHFSWDEGSKYFDEKSTPEAPRWFMVDVEFVEKLPRQVTLDELKAAAARGWGEQDARVSMLLQLGRAGLDPLSVPPERIEAIMSDGD